MPKSNEAINLSAVLNVGAGADSLPKNPTNAKGRDSWKKGDEKTQPVVLQEVDEARPPPPSKTVFEKPTPSSIQSFTSDFVPLVASAVPPKSGSTVRSISSLRAPRIRSRASHEPSVRRRPNRFGIDTECEGDDDGGESEAVALKEWAKSKGIAMEVPVGWTLTDGAASTANALQAPPPAEDAKRETDLEANPAAFDKATQSTFRPAVPALVSTSSAVPHGTLSSAASKAASSSASGMPISSRPDGGSLGTTPAPPHIESASLVPPVPRSIPSFPISKLPFSLVPPTSSPPVSPEATLETTDAKQGESKSQSMMRSHLGESEITSTPENDKTPNKTSLASASESMPTIFLSPRPPPLTQTAPDHPKANSFSTFGPLRGVSASGVPTAEKSVSASLSNSTSTSTPVEQLAEGGKEESPREPVAPTSFSSGSTGATPSVRTKANGTLGFNQPPSEANAPSSPQKMEDREKAPSSAFATSSFASVGRFSLSNPETSSTPSTQSSPPSMVKTAPAISMETCCKFFLIQVGW
ncbi:uncharacterized protein EI90DRAFT_2673171 [Cantharellus anzutake]|uniref:uncharacterized protein n=1 Tax=Cantharellus anzutake TaxID=1750568 RepID=UPI0019045D79|nr:uncharacterized protein EI90DRAFT_2673171 [Cantharellus anzutake]KAF8337625.1 hypothetical protein EI90DRAFT_2673171 [Cantharellus anzutake]